MNDDPFLNPNLVYETLVKEYITYNRLIIAYDFDNTIFDFHEKGYTFNKLTSLLNVLSPHCVFICYTARCEDQYPFIKDYIETNKIPMDYLNEGVPGLPYPEGKKLYSSILLDDKAGLPFTYKVLYYFYKYYLQLKVFKNIGNWDKIDTNVYILPDHILNIHKKLLHKWENKYVMLEDDVSPEEITMWMLMIIRLNVCKILNI